MKYCAYCNLPLTSPTPITTSEYGAVCCTPQCASQYDS